MAGRLPQGQSVGPLTLSDELEGLGMIMGKKRTPLTEGNQPQGVGKKLGE